MPPTSPAVSTDQPAPPTLEERVDRLERFTRRMRFRAVVVLVALTLVAAAGLLAAQHAGDKATRAGTTATDAAAKAQAAADAARRLAIATRAESIDRQVATCATANDFRRFLRGYLTSTSGSTSPEVLRQLPGYDALPPSTHTFVNALVVLLSRNAITAAQARDAYIASFPLVDCSALRRDLEAHTPGG